MRINMVLPTDEERHLVEEYCNASRERKFQMEQHYGKEELHSLVDTSLSENWLFNNSKKCPSFNAAIEVMHINFK